MHETDLTELPIGRQSLDSSGSQKISHFKGARHQCLQAANLFVSALLVYKKGLNLKWIISAWYSELIDYKSDSNCF